MGELNAEKRRQEARTQAAAPKPALALSERQSPGYSFDHPAHAKIVVSLGAPPWRPDARLWAETLRARPKGSVGEAEFRAWVEGPLKRFLPFRHALAAYGELSHGEIVVKLRVASGYERDWLQNLPATMRIDAKNCFSHWLQVQEPLLIDPAAPPDFAAPQEIDMLREFDLGLMAVHGVVDPVAASGSYVALSGLPRGAAAAAAEALDMVAPVLHALFLRTMRRPLSKLEQAGLTPRQMEIVRLAVAGMDDKSIARELGISEHTVASHLRAAYGRLGVRKRSQLASFVR